MQRYINAQRELSIQIDITNACNLRCKHCYHSHHDNEGALTFEGWMGVLDRYEDLLTKLRLKPRIFICGGEPLLSPSLRPLIENLNSRFPRVPISILTNGTLVRVDLAHYLATFNLNVQVSLDGPDAERHDAVRGKGSFQRAIKGIRTLKEAGISVRSLAVLSAKTAPWVDEFFALAASENLHSMNFTRFIPQGNGAALAASGADRMLNPDELRKAYQDIACRSTLHGVNTVKSSPLYHLIEGEEGGHAKFGHQGLVVDYKGRLKVSSRSDYILGDVLKDGLEDLFLNHPVMKSLRNGEIDTCGTCPFYARCGGDRNVAYAVHGSFFAPDPQCWILTKTRPH